MALRGVKASASAWGWVWVAVAEGGQALYVNAGIPERHAGPGKVAKKATDKKAIRHTVLRTGDEHIAHACRKCGYSDGTMIGNGPGLCDACRGDLGAIRALELQEQTGVYIGWRRIEMGVAVKGFHEDESGLSLTTPAALRMHNSRQRKKQAARQAEAEGMPVPAPVAVAKVTPAKAAQAAIMDKFFGLVFSKATAA